MGNRKNGKSRRQYPDELKAEAVQILVDGHSAESVASRLGLSGTNVLYRWKAKLLAASGPAAILAAVPSHPRLVRSFFSPD